MSIMSDVCAVPKIDSFFLLSLPKSRERRERFMTSFTKQKLAFSSGDRLPYIENSFYEKFKEPAFYLICITKEQVQVENKFPYPVKMLHFNDFQNWTKFGVVDDLFMMVRPDQHIFWISDSLENNELYTSV